MVEAWESDSSKLLARRRACVAGTERFHGRLAVLVVDAGEEPEQLPNSLIPQTQTVELRPLTIDLGRLRVDSAVPQMWLDGRRISLPPMEFLVLRFLAERIGELVTRQEILDAVWGENTSTRSTTLTVHMLRLRKRFGDDDANPQWIRAIRGLGYQFNVPPLERITPPDHMIGQAADA